MQTFFVKPILSAKNIILIQDAFLVSDRLYWLCVDGLSLDTLLHIEHNCSVLEQSGIIVLLLL